LYLVFLLFALAYAVLTPPGQAPDEMPHLHYVDFLLHERRLPHRFRDAVYQDHHPPLYYAAGALALKAGQVLDPRFCIDVPGPWAVRLDLARPALDREALDRGKALLPEALRPELMAKANLKPRHFSITVGQLLCVRLLSVLLALATLVCVDCTARLLLSGAGRAAMTALAFTALLPQFQFIGGVINCDIMAIFTANLLLYGLVRSGVRGTTALPRTSALLGLGLGLCLLSKMSGIAMAVPVVAAYALAARVTGVKRAGATLALALLVAVLAGGWWYALNFARYDDPFMVAAQAATMGEQIHQPPLNKHYFAAYLFSTVRSFFGQLGPFTLPVPDRAFFLYTALLGLALVGLALRFRKRPGVALPPGGRGALWVLGAGFLATWAVVFAGNLTFYSAQGRYLYPGLAAVAVALALGLEESLRPGRWLRLAAGLVLLAIPLDVFFTRFLPEYYPRRDRVDRPLILHYENAGHPHLSPALRAGTPFLARGGFGSKANPAATTARGGRVAFRFEKLPLGEPLQVRLRFGEFFDAKVPWRHPVQSVHLGGAQVAGGLMVTPRNREGVYAVPGSAGLTDALDVAVCLVPETGPQATVSEVWVEQCAVVPRALVVPAGRHRRGSRIRVEATVENRHPDEAARILLGFGLETRKKGGNPTWLGEPAALTLEAGSTVSHQATLTLPRDAPAGPARIRAFLAPGMGSPWIDINPCISTPSVGIIEPDPGAFGCYAIRSARTAGPRLESRLPLPATPRGRYGLRVHAALGPGSAALEAAILTQGRTCTTCRAESGSPEAGAWSEIESDFHWPGGPGEIRLDGTGDVRVDRIRLVPLWVPGVNLNPFPHESSITLE